MQLRSDVSTTETADGTVLLHHRTGRYWQLNVTGSRVLRHLLDGDSAERTAADMAAAYDIDPRLAAQDVHAVMEELEAAGLVVTQ